MNNSEIAQILLEHLEEIFVEIEEDSNEGKRVF